MDCVFYISAYWIIFHTEKNWGIMMKRGELATQQIVILIVLIVSFVIILFFLVRLNLGQTTEKEICHNSVVTRGSSVLPEESVPLKCQRSYICITEDGSCEEMTKPRKEKVKTDDDVYAVLAEELADCWWMFGEGKVNYVGKDWFENLYCSICAQIAFDDSVGDIPEFSRGEIDKSDFYRYLSEKNVSNRKQTYLEYLQGIEGASEIESSLTDANADFGSFDLNKQHYVMMGIYSEVGVWKWVAGLAGGVGIVAAPFTVGLSTIPTALIIGGAAGVGGTGGYFLGTAIKGDSGYEYLSPTMVEVNSRDFEDLDCGSIETLA